MLIKDALNTFLRVSNMRDETLRTYKQTYRKWYDELLRYSVNLFDWNGLPCTKQVHESYLIYKGFDGATEIDGELVIVQGGMSGVTNYPTIFTQFTYSTPINAGIALEIGKDIIICANNCMWSSDSDCIDSYAHLLSHVDLSIQCALINERANLSLTAPSQAVADTLNTWLNGVRNGKTSAIIDRNSLDTLLTDNGIKTLDTKPYAHGKLQELYNLRTDLLRDFFSERGFLSDKAKAERLVSAEIDVNLYRSVFSVSDMLGEREDFCTRVNQRYGVKWSVTYNEWILKQIKESQQNDERSNTNSTGNAELLQKDV